MIVKGKAAAPVKFGTKLDISVVNGLGRFRTKLEVTTRGAIALSILAMNLSKLAKVFLHQKPEWIFSRYRIKIREIISVDFGNSFGKEAVIV